MPLQEQRKAILGAVLAGLTFIYTKDFDFAGMATNEWISFVAEFLVVVLGSYYVVWVAPNEPSPPSHGVNDPKPELWRAE